MFYHLASPRESDSAPQGDCPTLGIRISLPVDVSATTVKKSSARGIFWGHLGRAQCAPSLGTTRLGGPLLAHRLHKPLK
jgi:hypothetical protein